MTKALDDKPEQPMTHTGQLSGDARSGGKKPLVELRETKNFWVTKNGTKYRKVSGRMAGGDSWPMWWLDVDTVKKKESA